MLTGGLRGRATPRLRLPSLINRVGDGFMRAISPLVAAAILLIVTLIGGVIIYNYVMNSVAAYAPQPEVTVDASTNATQVFLLVRIENPGKSTITISKAVIDGKIDITSYLPRTVAPGKYVSKAIILPLTSVGAGKHILVLTYNDGRQVETGFTI